MWGKKHETGILFLRTTSGTYCEPPLLYIGVVRAAYHSLFDKGAPDYPPLLFLAYYSFLSLPKKLSAYRPDTPTKA